MLADRGALVYAVEPNREMRDEGGPHPRVRWVDATAEATTLPGGSVGVVSCFQSFHWFDPERALPEFRRILTERGRVALIWNERDRQHDLTREYSALVSRFATIAPAEERQGVADPIFHTPFFRQPDVLVFTHEQRLGPGGLIGRARSTSYLPSEGPAAEELWNALRALETGCADETGSVRLRYLTRLYRASVK
jgi:SAM-dependent methyltransferase